MDAPLPDITIVVPTRDEGIWLRRTIDGVLATTHGLNFEIVVVDDGSTDGSADYLRGPKAPPVVRVVQGGELGVARARNRGAEHARGDKLVFLDANVVPDPGWLDAISAMLDTPDVGIVGVGVRDYENAASVGYSCVFVDERLQEGWSPRPESDDPFEVACIIGCCCGMRRELFESLGRFDTGHVRWGVEDLELSLRCWFTGHTNLVDPTVQVAHFFKHNKPRNFSVSWQQYDHNLLRCVMTYFTGRRASMILAAAAKRPSFGPAVASGLGNAAYWQRRAELRSRFTRDEEAFFRHFAAQFARFEARVAELTPGWKATWAWDAQDGAIDYDTRVLAGALASPEDAALDDMLWGLAKRGSLAPALARLTSAGYFCSEPRQASETIREDLASFARWAKQEREAAVMPVFRKVVCPSCGATNMGVQELCMICKAALPALELNATPAPAPQAPVTQDAAAAPEHSIAPAVAAATELVAPAVAGRLCAHCGARLAEGMRFCVECGTPADAAPPEPPAAPACKSCGAALPAGTRFCINCGTPIAV